METRSQDLEPSYHDAGQFYWFKPVVAQKHKKLWTNNTGKIEINELSAQDIDNETDWKLAELKYELLQNTK
jgi:N-acylneuraminate cytidylyltransferase